MESKKDNRIIIIPILIVLVFLCSIIGFKQISGHEFSLPGVIYATLSFFTLENMKPEEATNNIYLLIARYLAAAILGLGVYTLLYKYIVRQYTQLKIRLGYHNHVI